MMLKLWTNGKDIPNSTCVRALSFRTWKTEMQRLGIGLYRPNVYVLENKLQGFVYTKFSYKCAENSLKINLQPELNT